MKESEFNLYYPSRTEEGKWIFYNTVSNVTALIDNDDFELFNAFVKNRDANCLSDSLEQDLIAGGYIVGDDVDEKNILSYKLKKDRFESSQMGLTIAPTLDCNFRCIYCYEKKHYRDVKMSQAVQNEIIDFITNAADKIDSLFITWYGGEPLLALDVIQELSNTIIEISEKFNFTYSSSMVTNGYLLTAENAELLRKLKVNSIQITLDGTEKLHNKKRPLKDGGETYKTIINNLKDINGIFEDISIRVNCEKQDIDSFKDVYYEIKSLNIKNCFVYAAPIQNLDRCYSNDRCFEKTDFFETEYNLIKKFSEKDFADYILRKYPTSGGSACGADRENAMVIDANGNLFKCWSDMGTEELSYGNIMNLASNKLQNQIVYQEEYPLNRKKCSNCKFIPICKGGCPREFRMNGEGQCEYTMRYIEELLQDLVTFKKKYQRLHCEVE